MKTRFFAPAISNEEISGLFPDCDDIAPPRGQESPTRARAPAYQRAHGLSPDKKSFIFEPRRKGGDRLAEGRRNRPGRARLVVLQVLLG
jgi:hypothetical protein